MKTLTATSASVCEKHPHMRVEYEGDECPLCYILDLADGVDARERWFSQKTKWMEIVTEIERVLT